MNSPAASTLAAAPLPWHDEARERVRAAWAAGRLPHALLLHGTQGLGKTAFAHWLAAAVLCDAPRTPLEACATCAACLLFQAGSHPDLAVVRVLEDKSAIAIDQIRETCERLSMTSYRSGARVAIVEEAHRMTLNAANSLLKTLEEPPQGSLLILVTAQPAALPATVRSRCQRLPFRAPSPAAAIEWLEARTGAPFDAAVLEYAAGAPLAALAHAEPFRDLDERMHRSLADLSTARADVASIASAWAKDSLDARLAWLEYALSRRIRARFSGSADRVTQSAGGEPLPIGGTALNITDLYGSLDRVRELRRTLGRTALQKELAVEALLSELLRSLA